MAILVATSKDWYAWNQSIDIVWVGRKNLFPFIEHDSFLFFRRGESTTSKNWPIGSFLGHRLVGGGFCSSVLRTCSYTLHTSLMPNEIVRVRTLTSSSIQKEKTVVLRLSSSS